MSQEKRHSLDRASSELAKGNFDAAITHYREVLDSTADSVLALEGLAQALSPQKRYDEALAACRSAIEKDANTPTAHAILGTIYARQGRLDEGLAELEIALGLDAHLVPAYISQSVVYFMTGDFGKAEAALKQALLDEPKNSTIYHNLSLVYRQQKRLAPALSAAETAFVLRPSRKSGLVLITVFNDRFPTITYVIALGALLLSLTTRSLIGVLPFAIVELPLLISGFDLVRKGKARQGFVFLLLWSFLFCVVLYSCLFGPLLTLPFIS